MIIVVKGKINKGVYRVYAYIKSDSVPRPVFLQAKYVNDLFALIGVPRDEFWGKEFEYEYYLIRKE